MILACERPTVVITGADTPTGLTTARALNGLRVEVIGVAADLSAATCQSVVWDKILCVNGNASKQVEELLVLGNDISNPSKTVLLFSQDTHVIEAGLRLDALKKYFIVPLPDFDVIDLFMDKTKFHQFSTERHFCVPKSEVIESTEQLKKILKKGISPSILKPMVRLPSWDQVEKNKKFFSVNCYDDLNELIKRDDLFNIAKSYVYQRWIEGGDDDIYFVLFSVGKNNNILTEKCGRKIWQWPPLGGSTALCITYYDKNLIDFAREVILAKKIEGLVSVEFKLDKLSNNYYITEPTVGRNDYQSGLYNFSKNNPTRSLIKNLLDINEDSVALNEKEKSLWVDEISVLRYIRYNKPLWSLLKLIKEFLFVGRVQFVALDLRDLKPIKVMLSSLKWNSR